MRQAEHLGRSVQAGYLFLTLARDLVAHEVVVRWADALILAAEMPEPALLELATCKERDEALRILRTLAGGAISAEAVKLAGARIGQEFEHGALAPWDAARSLVAIYDLAETRESEEYLQAVAIEDDLEPGAVRDEAVLAAVKDDLCALLREFKVHEQHLWFAA